MSNNLATSIEFMIDPLKQTISFYFNNYSDAKPTGEIPLFKVALTNFRNDEGVCFADLDIIEFQECLKKTWIKSECFCGIVNDFGKHFIPSDLNLFESLD